MATKIQLENLLKNAELRASQYATQLAEEKARADKLQQALDAKFEPLEHYSGHGPEWAVWSRNDRRKDVVRASFKQILDWVSQNMGYSEDEDETLALHEKQATGLADLVYLDQVEAYWALRFAAEVLEQWNWRQECAKVLYLYEKAIAPYSGMTQQESTTVSWWAE